MALRITHTNNSSGHDGTYVFRSTATMDPQNLPTPIADEPPVALGESFEYVDASVSGDTSYYYRTQDHQGGSLGAVSDEVTITAAVDLSSVAVGDDAEGGIYAGTITYPDNSQYHIIFAKNVVYGYPDGSNRQWKTSNTSTPGTTDQYDGAANTQAMIDAGIADHPQGQFCVNHSFEEFSDWYMPSRYELAMQQNVKSRSEIPSHSATYLRSSTERTSDRAYTMNAASGEFLIGITAEQKTYISWQLATIPIRRVPV